MLFFGLFEFVEERVFIPTSDFDLNPRMGNLRDIRRVFTPGEAEGPTARLRLVALLSNDDRDRVRTWACSMPLLDGCSSSGEGRFKLESLAGSTSSDTSPFEDETLESCTGSGGEDPKEAKSIRSPRIDSFSETVTEQVGATRMPRIFMRRCLTITFE